MADLTGTLYSSDSLTGTIATVVAKEGMSAYEVAVKNGFEGTEAEWVDSLKGVSGYTPQRGTDYWTEADKAEVKSYIDDRVSGAILEARVE